jgi:hypothetical protein
MPRHGVLGTLHALVLRDASLAVPGGLGLVAIITGAVGLVRPRRDRGCHDLHVVPVLRRGAFAGVSGSARF